MLQRFRWIDPGFLAASGLPTKEDIKFIVDEKIQTIISFEPVSPIAEKEIKRFNIEHFTIPITDHGIPSDADVKKIFEIIEICKDNKQPVIIHCNAGIGRAGTIGALYLIKEKGFSWEKALDSAGGVETDEQANFIQKFANYDLAKEV